MCCNCLIEQMYIQTLKSWENRKLTQHIIIVIITMYWDNDSELTCTPTMFLFNDLSSTIPKSSHQINIFFFGKNQINIYTCIFEYYKYNLFHLRYEGRVPISKLSLLTEWVHLISEWIRFLLWTINLFLRDVKLYNEFEVDVFCLLTYEWGNRFM